VIETAIDYKSLYEESVQLHKKVVREFELKIAAFEHELANLKRIIFGSKSENFIPQNVPSRNQVEIKKNHHGRTKLPEHLERREFILEPLEKAEGCKKIGEEVTEELEYEPGKLFVNGT